MILPVQSIELAIMQKTKKDTLESLKAKYDLAMWKVEQLWNKMPERDYNIRKNLVSAAMGLVEIEQEIKSIVTKVKAKKI